MGQAGAQREPSMEEILASIRRIIENNEPGADGRPVDGNGETFAQDNTDEESYDADYAADSNSSGHQVAANDAPVAQPVSLADVAARARAMPETLSQPETGSQNKASAHTPDPEPDFIDVAAEKLREALRSDEPVRVPTPRVVEEEQHVEEWAATEPAKQEPAKNEPAKQAVTSEAADAAPVQNSSQPSRSETTQTAEPERAAETAQTAEAPQTAGGQLISLQTGEKVAAAFGELDAAIAAGQQRSFDEIAEEMLRPMLTQWLDDNLPTLVERLVREEIERVSRGNRR